MKMSKYRTEILSALLGMAIVFGIYGFFRPDSTQVIQENTFIDAPFSANMLLISSAGQSTDAYVFHDLANKLHLNNHFMPEADMTDVEKYSAAVIVVGYSEVGMMLNDRQYDEELSRVLSLIKRFKEQDRPVVTAFIGGSDRRNKKTDALLETICHESDYVILNSHDMDRRFVDLLSEEGDIPLSEVDSIEQVSLSLAFLFR
jgi:hypothetical protein